MHLGWSWLGLLAAYFWASSLWWLLDAVLQLLLIAAIHITCLGTPTYAMVAMPAVACLLLSDLCGVVPMRGHCVAALVWPSTP